MKIKVIVLFVMCFASAVAFGGYLPKGSYSATLCARPQCFNCAFDRATQTLRCTCWGNPCEYQPRGFDTSKQGCLFFARNAEPYMTRNAPAYLMCDDSYKQAGDKNAQVAYLIQQGFGPEDFIMLYPIIIGRGFKPNDFKQLLLVAIRQSNSLEMLKKCAENGLKVAALTDAEYDSAVQEAQALEKNDVVAYLKQKRGR